MRSQVTVTWGETATYRFDLGDAAPIHVQPLAAGETRMLAGKGQKASDQAGNGSLAEAAGNPDDGNPDVVAIGKQLIDDGATDRGRHAGRDQASRGDPQPTPAPGGTSSAPPRQGRVRAPREVAHGRWLARSCGVRAPAGPCCSRPSSCCSQACR